MAQQPNPPTITHPLLSNDEIEKQAEKLVIDSNSTFAPLQPSTATDIDNKTNTTNIKNDDEKKTDSTNNEQKDINQPITIKILMIRKSEPFFVKITAKSTVLELKEKIEKLLTTNTATTTPTTTNIDNENDDEKKQNDVKQNKQIHAAEMRLIYKGHALKNQESIKKYNIKDGHAIHLVPQKNNKTKSNQTEDDEKKNDTQTVPTYDHLPYNNVVCPKCSNHLTLTQPILCYAHLHGNRGNGTSQQTVTLKQLLDDNDNNNTSSDEMKTGAHCDMDGCLTPNIASTEFTYHCSNRRCHPFGYDLCQNCARYIDNPFCNLNLATNNVLKYQLNMFADIFFDRYRAMINRAIGGQTMDENDAKRREQEEEEKKSTQPQQSQPRTFQQAQTQRGRGGGTVRGRGRGRGSVAAQQPSTAQNQRYTVVRLDNIDYVKLVDEEGNVVLVPKARFEAVEAARNKIMSINDIRNIICNEYSEFRKRVAAIIRNPRLIREIFQKECPTLLRENLWIRKFLAEAFDHIECRIYLQARMALNLQDLIQIINDIISEQSVIQESKKKDLEKKNIITTFSILKATSMRWVKDEKVSNCTSCGAGFGFFSRKHHCKACGDIFCGKHAVERIFSPNRSLMKNRVNLPRLRIRVCDECSTKYQYYTYTKIPQNKNNQ